MNNLFVPRCRRMFPPCDILLLTVSRAQLVCSRGDIHFSPETNLRFADDSTSSTGSKVSKTLDLGPWEQEFRPVNENVRNNMYFL